MPQIVDNQDGTKSLTVSSSELGVFQDLAKRVLSFEKVLTIVEVPAVSAALDFLKAVASPGLPAEMAGAPQEEGHAPAGDVVTAA